MKQQKERRLRMNTNKYGMMFRMLCGALLAVSAVVGGHAAPPPPKAEGTLRILTYNVRNCVGMDNKKNAERVAEVIRGVDADVVALQELDWNTRRNPEPVISNLAARVGKVVATYGPAIDYQGGKYGVGVLSKETPLSVRQVPLPGNEKRTLLLVEFERFVFGCTHLALEEDARLASARLILDAVKDITKPVFFAGDMNTGLDTPFHAVFSEGFTVLSGGTQPTFPADKPTVRIDFIYAGKNTRAGLAVGGVLDEPMASDHRPVYVDVKMP
jgi:endonuclease/exonuclease/phosphatase family metal-dependent hydrolase